MKTRKVAVYNAAETIVAWVNPSTTSVGASKITGTAMKFEFKPNGYAWVPVVAARK